MPRERGSKDRNRNDALFFLASLFYYKKPIRGRTRLQKIMFLLKERHGIPFDFYFRPYYYGPYSDELSDLISLSTALNLAEEKAEFLKPGIIRYNYELTEKGKRCLEKFKENLDDETLKVVSKLKDDVAELSGLSTTELVSMSKALMKGFYK